MSHASFYVVESDGIYTTRTVSVGWMLDDTNEQYQDRLFRAFFRHVAELICFDDCGDDRVDEIVWNGHHVHYTGWQPGMVMEFADDETGEIIYSGSFPEWDH